VGVNVPIIPGPNRSLDEKKRLEAFKYTHDVLDISRAVEDAKDVMGLNGNENAFSTDILRVEISGPSQPHLTMVDLPGLFLAGKKDQSEEDSKLVKSLVLTYEKAEEYHSGSGLCKERFGSPASDTTRSGCGPERSPYIGSYYEAGYLG
jgi:hypothetical protein